MSVLRNRAGKAAPYNRDRNYHGDTAHLSQHSVFEQDLTLRIMTYHNTLKQELTTWS